MGRMQGESNPLGYVKADMARVIAANNGFHIGVFEVRQRALPAIHELLLFTSSVLSGKRKYTLDAWALSMGKYVESQRYLPM